MNVRALRRLVVGDKPLAVPTMQVQVLGAAERRFRGENALECFAEFRVEDAVDDGIERRIWIT